MNTTTLFAENNAAESQLSALSLAGVHFTRVLPGQRWYRVTPEGFQPHSWRSPV